MWRQHLFSARIRDESGDVDGFHVLTNELPGDYQFTERVQRRPDRIVERNAAFILDCGDNIYIGVDGTVADALPNLPEYAFEFPRAKDGSISKGRPITFVHGYFAPKGTPIPDINELLRQQPRHLEKILRRANEGEEKVVRAEQVEFPASGDSVTDWGRMAREFEKGKRPNDGATFTKDGRLFRLLNAPGAHASVQTPIPSNHESVAQKKTTTIKGMPRKNFIKVVSVALLVVISGIAAWKLIKHLKEKQKGNNETTR